MAVTNLDIGWWARDTKKDFLDLCGSLMMSVKVVKDLGGLLREFCAATSYSKKCSIGSVSGA